MTSTALRAAALLRHDYGVTRRYARAAVDAGLIDPDDLRGVGGRWYLA